jgi:predicted NBD/HSP70 family sugar kinase
MERIDISNNPPSAPDVDQFSDKRVSTPEFHFPIGACFLIGGSGFSVGLVNHEGQAIASSRSISWREIGVVADHGLTNQQVTERLFTRLFELTNDLAGKDRNRIALFGVSFAGPLTGEGDQVFAHGTNMGVVFERPLKDYLTQFANDAGFDNLSKARIEVFNDGAAGGFGELYTKNGIVSGAKDLIYLILGTGVGGARILDHKLDSTFTEAGHTLLRNFEGEYTLCSMADLESKGLFKEGAFITPTDGSSYFEHRVGGPWVAVRFAKYLSEISGAGIDALMSVKRPEECPEFTKEAIERMATLREVDVADWNRLIDKRAEKAINMLLRFHSEGYRAEHSSEFSRHAFEFEKALYTEVGKALHVLSNAYPDAQIVLGSTLAEVRSQNRHFLDMLSISTDGRAHISQISRGTEREAACLVPTLKTIASEI